MNSLLKGLRVLTLESFGAAPYGSMFLADLGAEVIKIEDPNTGGDASRQVGPYFFDEPGDSLYFQTFNRNKKSLGVNLKTPEGKTVLRRVAGKCDAVFNNLRGDLPEKLGVDYNSLKHVNPQIVCAHISAFGRDNERKARPGYDYLMQAEAGFMFVTGEPDGPPVRMGLSVVDFTTGLTTIVGMLSAIMNAKQTGLGCDVDACLFDVALHQTSYLATWYLNEGAIIERMPRSAHPTVAPTQLFRTSDGWIMVMCMKDKFWRLLLEKLDRIELADDERFSTVNARRENLEALTKIIDDKLMQDTTANWVEKLADLLPAAPVYKLDQALNNSFLNSNSMIETVSHPQRESFRILSNPLKINGERPVGNVCGRLGEDTKQILERSGFTTDEIADLERNDIVKTATR